VMMGREQAPEGFEAVMEARSSSTRVGGGEGPVRDWKPLGEEEALAQVAKVTGVSVQELCLPQRGQRRPERWLAMAWLREAAGSSNTRIAQLFGTSPPVVATAIRRQRRGDDPALPAWLEALREGVTS